MFKRIDHVEIVTDKPDETVRFYTDILGFHSAGARPHPAAGTDTALNLVYLDLGGTTVELMTWEGVPVAPEPPLEHLGYRMIAIEVEDMNRRPRLPEGEGHRPGLGPDVARHLRPRRDRRPQRVPDRIARTGSKLMPPPRRAILRPFHVVDGRKSWRITCWSASRPAPGCSARRSSCARRTARSSSATSRATTGPTGSWRSRRTRRCRCCASTTR